MRRKRTRIGNGLLAPMAVSMLAMMIHVFPACAQEPAVPDPSQLSASPVPTRTPETAAARAVASEATASKAAASFEATSDDDEADTTESVRTGAPHPITDQFDYRPAEFEPTPTLTPTPSPEAVAAPVAAPSATLTPMPVPPLPIVPPSSERVSPSPAETKDFELPAISSGATRKTSPTSGSVAPTSATPIDTTWNLDSLASTAPSPLATPAALATPVPYDGRLDINTATEEELARIPDIDAVRARLIVQHREAVLGFRRIDQLRDVFGISETLYQQISAHLKVGPRSGFKQGTLQSEMSPVRPLQAPVRPEIPVKPDSAAVRHADDATSQPATKGAGSLVLPSIFP